MQEGVAARNIVATVFCLLVGLLVIFAQVFKAQLRAYMESKAWCQESIWKRKKRGKTPDAERDIDLDVI